MYLTLHTLQPPHIQHVTMQVKSCGPAAKGGQFDVQLYIMHIRLCCALS